MTEMIVDIQETTKRGHEALKDSMEKQKLNLTYLIHKIRTETIIRKQKTIKREHKPLKHFREGPQPNLT